MGSLLQCSQICFAGQLLIGSYFGYVTLLTVPFEQIQIGYGAALLQALLVGISVATGVHIVGNIDDIQSRSYKFALIGALPTSFFFLTFLDNRNGVMMVSISSALLSNWFVRTKRQRSEKHRYSLLLFFLISASITLLVWSDCRFTLASEPDDLSEAVDYQAYQFSGPQPDGIWAKLKYTGQLWLNALITAVKQTQNPLLRQARQKVRQVSLRGSGKQISQVCRQQLRQFHPDRFTNANDKRSAQQSFMEIERLCAQVSPRGLRRTA